MNIETLEKRGIPHEVVKRWKASGMKFLLPIQAESVNRYGILDGASLVINGPGTSGKTFCGEMAAVRNAALGKKSAFLVPLKAIAEEKYRLFTKRYSPLGMRIALATRDRLDRGIPDGKFDMLISVYEKFNSLTAVDISLVRNIGCFVLDEFQMISDSERGEELELITAKIRAFNPTPQMVILMGEGSSPGELAEWLKLPFIEEKRRPVDLRLGVLHRGTFHFRGFNDFREGEEFWLENRDSDYDGPFDEQAVSAIQNLIAKGEQVLVFCSGKRGCVNLALYLADHLSLPNARESLEKIDQIAPSIQNENLAKALYGGTAFHHAELDSQQRALIEDGFRSGEIRCLVSTTTLASGVNLPAKNVFIEMMKYGGRRSANNRPMLLPISVSDFHQAAGRAGRLGSEDKFGRAVMMASTAYEHEILWDRYVCSNSEKSDQPDRKENIVDIVLKLAACGAADSREGLITRISGMYRFGTFVDHGSVEGLVSISLDYLEKERILTISKSGRIGSSDLGGAVLSSGLTVRTSVRIASAIETGEISRPLEALFFAFGLDEWIERAGYYSGKNISIANLFPRLSALSNGAMDDSEFIKSYYRSVKSPSAAARFGSFLFALEWIEGTPTRNLESFFERGVGGLRHDADTLAWILLGIERIARCSKQAWSGRELDRLSELAARLRFGVNESTLPLARLLEIDREFIRRLCDFGIRTVDDLGHVDFQTFSGILPPPVIERVVAGTRRNIPNRDIEEAVSPRPDKIVFTGQSRKRLMEIIILGITVFLQPKLYGYLQKLWWGYNSGKDWVRKDSLDPGFNQAKYISKLRRILRLHDVAVEIESDGAGSYRLILPEREDSADVIDSEQQICVDSR